LNTSHPPVQSVGAAVLDEFAGSTGPSKLPLEMKLAFAAGTMNEVEPITSHMLAIVLHRRDKGVFIGVFS
jgi:hypothetical protein